MPEGFVHPDFSGELQLAERVRGLPRRAHVKGMFLKGIVDRADAVGVRLDCPRYIAFKDYPVSEYLELLAKAAALVHPDVTPLDGLRRLGHTVYPTFISSTIGRVTMAVAGRDMRAAVSLAPRAYTIAGNTARIEILSLTKRSARLAFRNVWDWPGAYQVGIMEGAFDAYDVEGEVLVKIHSLCDAELYLEWRPR